MAFVFVQKCAGTKAFFYFIGNSFSYKVKMLRRDATHVELKMHLRAHTGAQRVTK